MSTDESLAEQPKSPLTPEDIAVLETPDEQLQAQANVFSFDVDVCTKRLSGGRAWQQLVLAHLYFDHVVTQMLTEGLVNPAALKAGRMSFAQKLELIFALGLLPKEYLPPIEFINRLRNQVAHQLEFKITRAHVLNFANCTPKTLKDSRLATRKKGSGPIKFSELLIVNLLMLDIFRQRNAYGRLRGSKAAANLRRVLERTNLRRRARG